MHSIQPDELAKFIKKNRKQVNFGTAKCAPLDAWIEEAEKQLGIKFTPSYLWFMKHYGMAEIDQEDIHTVVDPEEKSLQRMHIVNQTIQYRGYGSIYPHELALGSDHYGGWFVFNYNECVGEECPIYICHGEARTFYAQDFYEFLYKRICEIVKLAAERSAAFDEHRAGQPHVSAERKPVRFEYENLTSILEPDYLGSYLEDKVQAQFTIWIGDSCSLEVEGMYVLELASEFGFWLEQPEDSFEYEMLGEPSNWPTLAFTPVGSHQWELSSAWLEEVYTDIDHLQLIKACQAFVDKLRPGLVALGVKLEHTFYKV